MRPVAFASGTHRIINAAPPGRRAGKASKSVALLALAEPQFDLFVISDQNLRYQQNLTGRRIAIIELSTNKLRPLLAAAPLLVEVVSRIKAGDFVRFSVT